MAGFNETTSQAVDLMVGFLAWVLVWHNLAMSNILDILLNIFFTFTQNSLFMQKLIIIIFHFPLFSIFIHFCVCFLLKRGSQFKLVSNLWHHSTMYISPPGFFTLLQTNTTLFCKILFKDWLQSWNLTSIDRIWTELLKCSGNRVLKLPIAFDSWVTSEYLYATGIEIIPPIHNCDSNRQNS